MIDRNIDPYSYPLEPWWFTRPHSIHGLSHTRRVLIHAVALAEPADLCDIEFEALVYAVSWHDIARTHDGWEREHGPNAVTRIKELGLAKDLTPKVTTPLFFAIEWHSTDDELAAQAAAETPPPAAQMPIPPAAQMPRRDSRLRVLWMLKDADGLDRVRIHDLDVMRLRSEVARAREAEAWRLLREMP
jgi:hypothetical protein